MLQRKQSLFLLLAAVALALCFSFPIATYHATTAWGTQAEGVLNLVAKANPAMMDQVAAGEEVMMSQKEYFNTWPLLVLTLLVQAIAVVSIFLFKNRVRQMKVVAVAFLLCVVEIFLTFIWAVDAYGNVMTEVLKCGEMTVSYGVGTWCPIAAAVLLFLAQRGIKKDEEKVRAADRLR